MRFDSIQGHRGYLPPWVYQPTHRPDGALPPQALLESPPQVYCGTVFMFLWCGLHPPPPFAGFVEMRLKQITLNYLTGWFVPDLAMLSSDIMSLLLVCTVYSGLCGHEESA